MRPPLLFERVEPTPVVSVPYDLEPEGAFDYVIRPASDLEPGATYRLTITEGCGMGEIELTATGRADIPTELGTLVATPHEGDTVMVDTSVGSCTEPIPAMGLDLFLDPHPEAEPWIDLLRFTTYVDGGTPWQGHTDPGSMGDAIDLIYTECPGAEAYTLAYHGGLASGEHNVRFEASIPGGPVLATPWTRVRLDCGESSACSISPDPARPLAWSWIILPLLALVLRRLR